MNIRGTICDLLVLVGVASMAYGFWLAWRPLGLIVGGLMLATAAFFAGYRPARRVESED